MPNMTISDVTTRASFEKEILELTKAHSPERALKDAIASFADLPQAFNELRTAINASSALVKDYFGCIKEFNMIYGKTLGLGITARLMSISLPPEGYEEDSVFIKAMNEIGSEKDQRVKMKSAIALAKKIKSCISSRQSKLLKMETRINLAGSTEAEIATCHIRIEQIKRVIDELKHRLDAVSQVYCSAKRNLLEFIDDCDEQFKAQFANKSTGKEDK